MEFGDFEIPDCDCVHDGLDYPDDISDADFFEGLQLADDDARENPDDRFLYDDGSYEPPETDFGMFEDF